MIINVSNALKKKGRDLFHQNKQINKQTSKGLKD